MALGLCLKSLLRAFDHGRDDDDFADSADPMGSGDNEDVICRRKSRDIPPEMFNPLFVKAIVYIASRGTELSRDWTCKNLEIAGLTMYEKAGGSSSAACHPRRKNASLGTVEQSAADTSALSSDYSGEFPSLEVLYNLVNHARSLEKRNIFSNEYLWFLLHPRA